MAGLLDAPSILFSAGFIGLVGSVLLVRSSQYSAQRGARAVPAAWIGAAMVQAFASFGHAVRADVPPEFAFSFVNAIQLLAVALLWLGARQLAGHSPPRAIVLLPPLLWLMACLVPGFMAARELRVGSLSILIYGIFAWAILDLVRIYRRHRLRAALDMAMLVGLVVIVLVAIILSSLLFGFGPSEGAEALFIGVPGLLTALYGTTLPFLMLTVAREWDALDEGERRAASLKEGRATVERLHGGLPALIFVREFDADGRTRLLYRGGNVEAVTGFPPGALNDFDNLATLAEDRSPVTRAMENARRSGTATADWSMRRPDGSGVTWLRTSMRVEERRPDGGITLVGYSINITNEREAQARAAASGRLASLGEMATGLAHELTQPLQAIMTGTEMAQLDAQRIEAAGIDARLETVIGQVVRARSIISNLRRFARGEPPGAPVRAIPVEAAIGNVMVLIGGLMRDADIEVVTDIAPDARFVLGHPVALEQVLTNLLINARDALAHAPEGAPRRVTLATEAAEGTVRLRVADTGGGIPPEIAAHVFEPFVTTKGPDNGTGLGLSISHGLVTAMGGTITAGNAVAGAVFTITLPMAAAEGA
ncbi:sensor histidine kinase [Sediminicoccus rosea]|uniref:histidine kinase n=1 Tax=Sediminicoccus rosea TaxID=1225128 RepID=A0ABZ0PHU7_9PROT|nr:ATP-binding protein [Sediminicoccus rosea]WPB85304.1 ATP-binding protein [Sediminicoccus rosea]